MKKTATRANDMRYTCCSARPALTKVVVLLTLVTSLMLGACAKNLGTTRFTNPKFDFTFVEKVAVLPLDNLSGDRQSGVRTTRLLITELLASGAVDVIEPGEVRAVLNRLAGATVTPSNEEIVQLGKMLGVQAILVGTVTQSESVRSGAITIPVVTLDIHMLETETGATVWAATHTETGAGLGAKVLGTGVEPISATTRRCVRKILRSLLE